MTSPFTHINLAEQALPGSLSTAVIADGAVTLNKLAAGIAVTIHADSNPNLTGNIQLISGTGVTLSQTGQAITITSTGGVATGNLTDGGTDGITVTGGTGAVVGSGTSLAQHIADASHNGYLSSTDWSTFNSKQTALGFTPVNVAGDTMTGTLTLQKASVLPVSPFSASGGSITPDARNASVVLVTVDAACTLHGPSNPYDTQKITFVLNQDGSGHLVTFTTGSSGEFSFGSDIPSFTASGAGLSDIVGVMYNSVANRWFVVSVIQGFTL